MQDIDFDELDRAVSSALGQDVSQEASKAAPQASVQPAAAIKTAEPIQAITVAEPVAPPSSQAVVKRSSGRFMDVVHPSSDMRTATLSRPPSENLTVAAPVVVAPTPVVVEPDPIVTPAADPLETPFLTDAKVEKRPLGAFSRPDRNSETEEEAVIRSLEAEDQPLPEAEPLLQPVIEKNEAETIEEPEVAIEIPAPVSDKQATSVVPDTSAQVGPTSITQQYTERPGTDTSPTGAIFDTEAYHKPLTHTAKARHGVFIIAMIITLTITGAVAGAVLHFFVFPLL